jgi:hypothetical protein
MSSTRREGLSHELSGDRAANHCPPAGSGRQCELRYRCCVVAPFTVKALEEATAERPAAGGV